MTVKISEPRSFGVSHPMLQIVVTLAILVAAIVLLTAIFGMTAGPAFELAPDPAGAQLPF